ncbi:MAG: Acetyltransferase, GNAT family [Rhodanobacteraceae bacterium]|jgi:GNAT superfamily N-acetyltransferase|nr:MAG: Acetyltransferase, GNAT family [Rhodanobacteraceae bacterium]
MLVTIRAADPADIPFLVNCNAAMALETEHKTLDREVLTRGTQAVFDDPRRGFYLVAELDGRPAGCLLITYEWSDWRNGDWWWFQSVYVTKAARRSGVFRALYADVERRARATPNVVGLRLYVEGDNARALQTYVSLGMEEEAYKMLRRGFIEFA